MASQAGRAVAWFGWNMKRVIDISEVLGTMAMPEGLCEVCAAADATYDEDAARLIVKLNAYLRTTDLRAKERSF